MEARKFYNAAKHGSEEIARKLISESPHIKNIINYIDSCVRLHRTGN
jgi:hypothetical protein